jgi:hypothetical protein
MLAFTESATYRTQKKPQAEEGRTGLLIFTEQVMHRTQRNHNEKK